MIGYFAERDSLGERAIIHLQQAFAAQEQFIDGLGFCLSEQSDLLSQWRGYAGDATGVLFFQRFVHPKVVSDKWGER